MALDEYADQSFIVENGDLAEKLGEDVVLADAFDVIDRDLSLLIEQVVNGSKNIEIPASSLWSWFDWGDE